MSTEKKLEDYLHLYLGCKCETSEGNGTLCIVTDGTIGCGGDWGVLTESDSEIIYDSDCECIKPILRTLSDMTEEEKIMLCCLNMPIGWQPGHIIKTSDEDIAAMRIFDHAGEYKSLYISKSKITPNNFIWLLSNHFDLFGLIESGLAISKSTL